MALPGLPHQAIRGKKRTQPGAEKDGKPSDPIGFESLTCLEAGRLLLASGCEDAR